MIFLDCTHDHLEAIQAIFNEAIVNSTALYDYEPRSSEVMDAWWVAKQEKNLPVIGVLDEDGTLMGFGSYGPFRPHAAYQHTVEHSIYVDARFRGRGLGKELLHRLIERATQQGYHMMIGVIDAEASPCMRKRVSSLADISARQDSNLAAGSIWHSTSSF
jgi:phosphinothricin acetyltransferase